MSAGEWGAARVESHELETVSSRDSPPAASLPLGGSSDAGNGPGDGRLVLYRRGEACDAFSLILQGKVLIRTGAAMCGCLGRVRQRETAGLLCSGSCHVGQGMRQECPERGQTGFLQACSFPEHMDSVAFHFAL